MLLATSGPKIAMAPPKGKVIRTAQMAAPPPLLSSHIEEFPEYKKATKNGATAINTPTSTIHLLARDLIREVAVRSVHSEPFQ